MRKLKLIWDFRGPDAQKIAEHHVIHLKDYIASEKINCNIIGSEPISEIHHIAFMVIEETIMKPVRDALRPHRGQVYKE